MTPEQFAVALAQLGMTQSGAGRFLEIAPQTVRRYVAGTLTVPTSLALLLTAMIAKRIKPNGLRELAGLATVDVDRPSGRPKNGK